MKHFSPSPKFCRQLILFLVLGVGLVLGASATQAQDATLGNHGRISHNNYKKGQTASCSIKAMPKTESEFDKLQAQIGTEPQGGVMCFLAAMNVYVNNEKEGIACLKKASYNLGNSEISTLKQKLRGPANDSYVQKYLPFAHLKGATPENGYKPTDPLTVEVAVNNGRPYSILSAEEAPIIYLNFKTQGTDMGQRPVSVIRPYDSDYYVVYDRGGLILQVQNIKRPKRARDLED